jgi:hypothetical protein
VTSSTTSTSTVVLVGLVLAAAFLPTAAGVAAAQQGGQQTATPAPAPSNETVVAQVDSQVRVTDYGYNDDKEVFRVELQHTDDAGSTATVTITEMVRGDSSSGTFGIERIQLSPGETVTVEVDAERYRGVVGVMIVTETSLENGEGVFLKDEDGYMQIFEGEATWGYVRLAAAGAVIGVVALALGIGWHRVADDSDNVEVRT